MLSDSEVEKLIATANRRLGKGGLKLEVSGKKRNISVRGMFPPKPSDRRTGKFQTRVSLKVQALTKEDIKSAEDLARAVLLDLNRGVFDWSEFLGEEKQEGDRVADWVKRLESEYWKNRDGNDLSKWRTWQIYERILRKLPPDAVLSNEVLLEWIEEYSKPATQYRRQFCTLANWLGELAGLKGVNFNQLRGKIPIAPVNPRDLPTDEWLVNFRDSIKEPGWKYIYSLMLCWGLRPHEVWKLDYSQYPILWVHEDSKTGARGVLPCLQEWAEKWELEKPVFPDRIEINDNMSNTTLGRKVTAHWSNHFQWSAYNLRHCYARRLLENKVPPDVGAKLMGHSLQIHTASYRRYIDQSTYLEVAKEYFNPR